MCQDPHSQFTAGKKFEGKEMSRILLSIGMCLLLYASYLTSFKLDHYINTLLWILSGTKMCYVSFL